MLSPKLLILVFPKCSFLARFLINRLAQLAFVLLNWLQQSCMTWRQIYSLLAWFCLLLLVRDYLLRGKIKTRFWEISLKRKWLSKDLPGSQYPLRQGNSFLECLRKTRTFGLVLRQWQRHWKPSQIEKFNRYLHNLRYLTKVNYHF